MTEERYEYLLKFWGGRQQQVIDSLNLEHEEGEMYQLKKNRFGATTAVGLRNPQDAVTLFFNTKEERDKVKRHVMNAGEDALATSCEEGTTMRECIFVDITTKGSYGEYRFMYDCGYGYPEDSARYMFNDGNYSCDCNKSLFIREVNPTFPALGCGDEIGIKQFDVHHVPLDEVVGFREKYATLMTN